MPHAQIFRTVSKHRQIVILVRWTDRASPVEAQKLTYLLRKSISMRLLNIQGSSPKLENAGERPKVPYIILSHTWLDPDPSGYQKEILFDDLYNRKEWTKKPAGAAKVTGACEAARRWFEQSKMRDPEMQAIDHLWIDSCCIDQKHPVELSAAINSMYRWYQKAEVCLVYLSDVKRPEGRAPDLSKSKWFQRGWTLQELVASKTLEFYDVDWQPLGNDTALRDHLSSITGIDRAILAHKKNVSNVSIEQRMSWASGRETRLDEDKAYCLMGLFGVQMPTLYGEGLESAFRRLQEEIIKYSDDRSVFAWQDDPTMSGQNGLLARSPTCFQLTGMYAYEPNRLNNEPYAMTNKGISISLCLQKYQSIYIASLDCPVDNDHYLGIYLECIGPEIQQYSRIKTDKVCKIRKDRLGQSQRVYVEQFFDI